jgi:hypothetical protein
MGLSRPKQQIRQRNLINICMNMDSVDSASLHRKDSQKTRDVQKEQCSENNLEINYQKTM